MGCLSRSVKSYIHADRIAISRIFRWIWQPEVAEWKMGLKVRRDADVQTCRMLKSSKLQAEIGKLV